MKQNSDISAKVLWKEQDGKMICPYCGEERLKPHWLWCPNCGVFMAELDLEDDEDASHNIFSLIDDYNETPFCDDLPF